MSFNNVGQFNAPQKTWDHVGNMIPDVEHSEGERPHGEFMPAAWLPVKFFEKYYENYICVMPGKVVALDNDGRVVPAQYGLAGATITYTATDVTAGVIDVRTGVALLTANIGTFNVSGVSAFMGRSGVTMDVSDAVGVAPYAYLQWAGDGSSLDDGTNPAAYRQGNYNMQHRVAILCDYVLELPIVPAKQAATNVTKSSYDSAGKVVYLNNVSNLPVAKNTQRTPIVFTNGTLTDAATVFTNEVASASFVKTAGDFAVDYTLGTISYYYASDPGGGNIYQVSYYHYASAPSGANVSVFASVLGNVHPGDFLKVNADSNYVVDSSPTVAATVGQVLDIETYPRDGLDKVRTAYDSINTSAAGALPGYAGQMDQMPGSATGGVNDSISYAGAANKVCRVNLILR